MVEALKKAGNPPTRTGLMKALLSLNSLKNPFLLPGFVEKTSGTDHFPIEQLRLTRYHSTGGAGGQGYWEGFGRVYSGIH